MPCVHDGKRLMSIHDLRHASDKVYQHCALDTMGDLYLEMDGVYRGVPEMANELWMPDEWLVEDKLILWGFRRNGDWQNKRNWMIARASFNIFFSDDPQRPYHYANVISITVKPATTAEIINLKVCSPRDILDMLLREYFQWFEKFDERHKRAERVNFILKLNENLVGLCGKTDGGKEK